MKIDIEAARLGRNVIDLISKKDMLSDDLLSQYYYSEGIKFLMEHLKCYGGFELTIDRFKYFFGLPIEKNVFERPIHLGLSKLQAIDDAYFAYLQEILKTLEDDTMSMVGTYLPNNIEYPEIMVYFLFGIRGTSIVLKNKIAIDLCDDSLYENGSISIKRLQQMLAHEVHHIGVTVKFQEFTKSIYDERDICKYSIIADIISEGMACFYFTPEITNQNEKQWNVNLTDIDTKIEELKLYLADCNRTENETSALQGSLFGDSLLGYTIGYVMIERIHNRIGLDRVIKLLDDFCLFEVYAELAE